MPMIEYLKEYEHPKSGRIIPKGAQGIMSRKKARKMSDDGIVTVIGSESTKTAQRKTEENRNPEEKKSTKKKSKSKSTSKSKSKDKKSGSGSSDKK